MTRRSMFWWVVAVLFSLVNLVGAGVAAAGGELRHAALHVALLLPGVYLVRRFAPRRNASRIVRAGESASAGRPAELDDRLTHLEQSVDAVAIEVERIGEGQRFITRVFTDKGAPRAAGGGAAAPVEIEAPPAAPHLRRE